jgi:tetratricopeptide (TPR) repeat protein
MASLIRSDFLFLTLVLASVASAASPGEKEARAAALEGKKAFDLGDYAKAIAQYEKAYQLKAAPGLLFNLGQSHRKAGNLDRATFYFRRYLETNPPSAQAKATEDVLAEVEKEAAAQKVAQNDQQKADAERLKLEEERKHALAETQRKIDLEKARLEVANAEQRRLELEAALKKDPPPPPVYQRWWFWTAIGAVVVGGAVTATVVATAPQPALTTFPDINARQ